MSYLREPLSLILAGERVFAQIPKPRIDNESPNAGPNHAFQP